MNHHQYNNALHTDEAPNWEVLRFLQEQSSSGGGKNNTNTTQKTTDSEVLRNTFAVYGSVWLVILLLFCFIRRKWSKSYTIRQWVDEFKTPLAKSQFGLFSWIWKVFQVDEDKFMLECGLDALCLVRIMSMGFKVAVVAALNAIWLLPVYATSPPLEKEPITDRISKLTMSAVPDNSVRMIATVVGCYIIFGYVMHLIYKEFNWFINMRHKFLALPKSRNYAVYVRNIPSEFRDNAGVLMFFKECFTSNNALHQSKLRIKTPELSQWDAERTKVQEKLEHAIALQEKTGETPRHKTKMVGGHKVDSISTYTKDLQTLNESISNRITELEEAESRRYTEREQEHDTLGLDHGMDSGSSYKKGTVMSKVSGAASKVKGATTSAVRAAGNIMSSGEDGGLHSAGFLTFNSLRDRQAALQIVHYDQPFDMEVEEAADPDDILWFNVGRNHKDLELGTLFSLSATATLCLLWTIPISFFASLSSVGALREKSGFIDNMLDTAPFLEPVFEILAPLLVVIVNGLLPTILRLFTLLEGLISHPVVEASLFTKLSAFMIIQTFFVSAISSGILDKLSEMIDDPSSIINLLATSLPQQSTYFVQILVVYTSVTVGLELLGIPRLIFAFLRKHIGPNLTEKERKKPVIILYPLHNPKEMQIADISAQMVLYFTVLLVYSTIAPLSSFIIAALFLYVEAVYRHQYIYIYPNKGDSGGQVWLNFIKVLFYCMLIAEFTVVGLMALKKGAISTPLMIPLIIVTILFNSYMSQKHYRVAHHLPSHRCLQVDKSRVSNFDRAFLDNAYIQPEMKEKYVYPENLPEDRQIAWGLRPDVESARYNTNNNTKVTKRRNKDNNGLNTSYDTTSRSDSNSSSGPHAHDDYIPRHHVPINDVSSSMKSDDGTVTMAR